MGDRLAFGLPWVDLLALPIALLLSFLVRLSNWGSLLLVPAQIQFHELGHALLAWLSGRAALPLPFGFTFWREQQSVFTGCCMAFLLGVLLVRAVRERRPFGAVLASSLLLAFLVLSLLVAADTSRMLILLAGLAGELVLTSLAIVAFYFEMPDRLRWDFFRFIVLFPATGSWLAAVQLWLGVARGKRALPTGSILGTTGDGSGDLDRLLAEYDFSEASITTLYGRLSLLTAAVVVVTYGVFALRAAHKLWPARRFNRFAERRIRERDTR
ncbi:MAG: hypothetical protein JWN04_5732 [Myxococcaceae bacterium]|nr:hypothetical protein [Myxococcaceae bacterium]